MSAVKLLSRKYMADDSEWSGSFFTSIKFLSTEHYHDFYEFCLIIEGEIMHVIDGNSQLLTSGSMLFIRPQDTHYFKEANKDYFQYVNLAVKASTIDNVFRFLGEGFKPERLLGAPAPVLVTLPKSELHSAQQKFEYFILTPQRDKNAMNSELRATLVNIFTQYFPVKLWEDKTPVPMWLDWLYKNMHNRDNFVGGVQRMQEISCKSHEHLCRQFKKYFDKTPTEFINKLRLDYARNLLLFSDEKVVDISYSSGFSNLSHFYHEFKKQYGLSPITYRYKYQHNIIGGNVNSVFTEN
jgi:AraC family cel operon transcriptional repressor